MTDKETNPTAQTMDREHQIQIGLIDALCQASEQVSESSAKAAEILAQLVSYSSAHFMSEELLMRIASYDGYEDHVADHIYMMDELDAMVARQQAGEAMTVLESGRAIRDFITRHIDTRDRLFAESMVATTHR
jgi:hemerythrin